MKVQVRHIGLLLIIGFASLLSCETAEIQSTEIEFFIANEWKLESFYGNGVLIDEETIKERNASHSLKNYKIKLNDDFTFDKTGFDNTEKSGTWELTAGLSQLILYFDDDTDEHYLILSLEVRKLELRVLKESGKVGEIDIRYILVPVRN